MMSLPRLAFQNQLAIPNVTSSSADPAMARVHHFTSNDDEHRVAKQQPSTNEKANADGSAKAPSDAKRKRAKLPSTPKEKERSVRKKKGSPPHHDKLGPYDVICGRSSSAFNNVGNRRFRVTMSLNLNQYMEAPTRLDKSMLIISIAQMIKSEQGGRFLIQKAKSGNYVELNDKQIREKIGHALRDLAGAARKGEAEETELDQALRADNCEASSEASWKEEEEDETIMDPLPLNSPSWNS
jgi:hypothetical protein